MMKFFLSFLLCACVYFTCIAQDSLQILPQRFGGGGYFKIGYGSVSTNGIPEVLGSRSTFATDVLSVGGGGFAYLNRIIIGGNGFGMLGSSRGDTLIAHGGGGFEFGYDLLNHANRQLLATVMLGGRGTSVNISDNSTQGIASGSIMVGINLHLLHYVFFSPKEATESGGIHIGLRLSAWTSFAGSTWERDRRKIAGADSYHPQGVMLSATFGGAGFGNKQR